MQPKEVDTSDTSKPNVMSYLARNIESNRRNSRGKK
jgi:hypothetical protein